MDKNLKINIKNFVIRNSYFKPNSNDVDEVFFSTRKHSFGGHSGDADFNEGYRIKKMLIAEFGNMDIEVRSSDEWVSLSVYN